MKKKDVELVLSIFSRLEKQKTLERKETVLLSLEQSERELFTKALLLMVENKALDRCTELQ
jgi:hypothetical protein